MTMRRPRDFAPAALAELRDLPVDHPVSTYTLANLFEPPLSLSGTYRLIAAEGLDKIKIGGRVYVAAGALVDLATVVAQTDGRTQLRAVEG